MKQFFKFLFASCLGTLLALCVLLFILFGVAGSLATTTNPVTVPQNAVLHLEFNYPIPELTDNFENAQDSPVGFDFEYEQRIGLNDIKRILRAAASDPAINGLYINTQESPINPTIAYTIASEIETFKESGKPVWAYGNYFTQSGYIIAAVADSIFLNPNGIVDLRGYGILNPYFEKLDEKYGIDFDIYHAGKYKSAVEPYYRTNSSAENRYQVKEFLSVYHEHLASHIAHYRSRSPDEVSNLITNGLSINEADAINYNLSDELLHFNEFQERWDSKLDIKKTNFISLEDYMSTDPFNEVSSSNKIAVIYAEGDITINGDEKGIISMDVYNEIFDRLEKNDKIQGVVLRVNSPGGSASTSDEFLFRINRLRDLGKYVVASFGTYAASGGYYIAASADKIVCEPTSLTGAIGVFSLIPDFSDLSNDHLGISWDTISTGKRAFVYTPFIKRSNEDNLILQKETNRIYDKFKGIVSEGRSMPLEDVQDIAQGRVWSGEHALGTGLIDTLGSLDDAIELVAHELGYENDYKIFEYPIIERSFLEQFLSDLSKEANIKLDHSIKFNRETQNLYKLLTEIEEASQSPQAKLPFQIISY